MDMKRKSLTSLLVALLLFRHVVKGRSFSYQLLIAYTNNTIDQVEKAKISLTTQYSINESIIAASMNRWSFGISDCWNYTITEDERLSDNYVRLKIMKNQSLSISSAVHTEISNLQRAVRLMRKKLGYPRVNTKGHPQHSLPTVIPQDQGILEVVFLSTVNKNLKLMLNDFKERIYQTKA